MLINRRFYVGNSQSILVQTGVNETMSESCLITELRRRVLPHFLPIDCYNHEFEALSKSLTKILRSHVFVPSANRYKTTDLPEMMSS